VGEFRADTAGIDVPELLEDLRQLHLLFDAAGATRGKEDLVEVGTRQPDVCRIEHPGHRPLHESERVDVCDQVAAIRVELDEPGDGRLLLAVTRRLPRGRGREAEKYLNSVLGTKDSTAATKSDSTNTSSTTANPDDVQKKAEDEAKKKIQNLLKKKN
jgi:hypothetical protein